MSIKYRLEIDWSNINPENVGVAAGVSELDGKIMDQWSSSIHKSGWLTEVYFCDECGEELTSKDKLRSDVRSNIPGEQCKKCYYEDREEPASGEVTAGEWFLDAANDSALKTESEEYELIAAWARQGFREGIQQEREKHRLSQTLENWWNRSDGHEKIDCHRTTAKIIWNAAMKARGYDE